MICLDPSRAPSTAVVPWSLSSGLEFLSVLLLDLYFPCVSFVPLDFASSQLPILPARWTYHLVPSEDLIVSQGICMSDRASASAISALTEAKRLNRCHCDSQPRMSEDFWPSGGRVQTLLLHYCLDLAVRKLTGKPPLHNQNDMVTHFKASSWVSEAQGAVVFKGVTTCAGIDCPYCDSGTNQNWFPHWWPKGELSGFTAG